MLECIYQGLTINVVAVVYHFQINHLQMQLNNFFAQLTSFIIGFDVLVTIVDKEQVYTKRR